jgi:hypothetical protein
VCDLVGPFFPVVHDVEESGAEFGFEWKLYAYWVSDFGY